MPDDERPSLEAPQLFGRRRARRKQEEAPTATPPVSAFEDLFEDSGRDTAPETGPATSVLPAVDDVDDEPAADDTPAAAPARARVRRTPRERSGPLLPGRPAAALTGVVVGLALLGFTWLGFQGCEAVRGTSSCGTAPGMVALVVIFVAAVAVGGVLLSRFAIPDPGATSFLGTGVTAVVYLLAVDYLDNWSVLVVVPVVTAATFVLAWFVTTAFVDLD